MANQRVMRVFARWLLLGTSLLWLLPRQATAATTISNDANLGGYSAGTVQIELAATGGTAPYVWSLTSGSLPPGIAVRADLPSWFSQFASAGLIGVATTPGSYSFTLTATDSTNSSASQAFTLNITPLTILDPWDLMPDGFIGTPYNYTMSAAGANGGVTWIVATCCGSLPGGLTLDTGTGVISGTPNTPGIFNFVIVAADATRWRSSLARFRNHLPVGHCPPWALPVNHAYRSGWPTSLRPPRLPDRFKPMGR